MTKRIAIFLSKKNALMSTFWPSDEQKELKVIVSSIIRLVGSILICCLKITWRVIVSRVVLEILYAQG